jgi:hypothetical protein
MLLRFNGKWLTRLDDGGFCDIPAHHIFERRSPCRWRLERINPRDPFCASVDPIKGSVACDYCHAYEEAT